MAFQFQPAEAWALIIAGAVVLASIRPSYGAVMGWIEREQRRGLAVLKEGARIAPVDVTPAPHRDTVHAQDTIRAMRSVR